MLRKVSRIVVASVVACVVLVYAFILFRPYFSPQNPPFENKLGVSKTTLINRMDTKTENLNAYTPIQVYDESGHLVTLNAVQHPLFFEAYWCPHCQRTLVLWNQNRENLKDFPWIVSLGYARGTKLADAVRLSHEELNAFHITNVHVYYLLNEPQNRYQFPTLVFSSHGHAQLLMGEHTLRVWQQAIQ